jgi:hypothetical protein
VADGKHRDKTGEVIPYRKPWPIKCGTLVQEDMDNSDVTDPEYWRNSRGFWSPLGVENTIYTAEGIKSSGAEKRFQDWWLQRPKVRVMGVDSAFSSDGDESIAAVMDMGYCSKRKCSVVDIVALEEIVISAAPDAGDADEQVGKSVKELASKYAIPFANIGFDSTNSSAANYLAQVLGSNEFSRVNFKGNATDTPINDLDPTPAKDKYGNRVTELWFFGRELIRHRQLYGITPDLSIELVARRYVTGKSGQVSKLTAESKEDMKKRGLHSPDRSDAVAIALDVLRQRHGLRTMITKLENSTNNCDTGAWLEYCRRSKTARTKNRLTYKS